MEGNGQDESEPVLSECLGTVVWFSDQRGFGFISVEGLGDVYCHYSAIKQRNGSRRSLLKDQRVRLHVLRGQRGWLAAEVEISS
jgi:CspA family cold shock protein